MAYTRRGFAQNFWVVKTVGCDSVGMGGIIGTAIVTLQILVLRDEKGPDSSKNLDNLLVK